MATMITNECINCGACEPECPNNAISQAEELYVIDPLLCTECVGFHDYEACAAVCPVDCCVTDPNNIETEEALITRARALHSDVTFGETFESRFRKGEKPKEAPTARPKETPAPEAIEAKPVPQPPPRPATAEVSSGAVQPTDGKESFAVPFKLPEPEEWEVPVHCFKCGGSYQQPAKHFKIGNVLWCPHCHKSMVVKDNLNYQIRTTLTEFYGRWERELAQFRTKREVELREFQQRRANDLRNFESRLEAELERVKKQIRTISQSYDAPGKPGKKRGLFLGA